MQQQQPARKRSYLPEEKFIHLYHIGSLTGLYTTSKRNPRRLYSSATRAARPAQPTVVFRNGDGWFIYNLACNLAAQ